MKNLIVTAGDCEVNVQFPASERGDWTYSTFNYMRSWKECCSYGRMYPTNGDMYDEIPFDRYVCKPKISSAQLFTQIYGVSPTIVKDRINRAMFKAFGLNKYVIFTMFDRPGKIAPEHTRIVLNVQQCREAVDRTVRDGLYHLVPLIVATKMGPHDLKTLVGKGAWKRLAANSFGRNKLLCHKLIEAHRLGNMVETESLLPLLNQFPTTVLKEISPDLDILALEALVNQCQRRNGTLREFAERVNINFYQSEVNDTVSMCQRLNRPFNPQWSERRIREEHDKCSQLMLTKTYSATPFAHLSESHEVQLNEFRAELLRTPLEIAMEGKTMHHCVASYVDQVNFGNYLVYRLFRDEQHVGTIGVRFNPQLHIDQIQGPCNSHVEVTDEFKQKFLTDVRQFINQPEHPEIYPVADNFFAF